MSRVRESESVLTPAPPNRPGSAIRGGNAMNTFHSPHAPAEARTSGTFRITPTQRETCAPPPPMSHYGLSQCATPSHGPREQTKPLIFSAFSDAYALMANEVAPKHAGKAAATTAALPAAPVTPVMSNSAPSAPHIAHSPHTGRTEPYSPVRPTFSRQPTGFLATANNTITTTASSLSARGSEDTMASPQLLLRQKQSELLDHLPEKPAAGYCRLFRASPTVKEPPRFSRHSGRELVESESLHMKHEAEYEVLLPLLSHAVEKIVKAHGELYEQAVAAGSRRPSPAASTRAQQQPLLTSPRSAAHRRDRRDSEGPQPAQRSRRSTSITLPPAATSQGGGGEEGECGEATNATAGAHPPSQLPHHSKQGPVGSSSSTGLSATTGPHRNSRHGAVNGNGGDDVLTEDHGWSSGAGDLPDEDDGVEEEEEPLEVVPAPNGRGEAAGAVDTATEDDLSSNAAAGSREGEPAELTAYERWRRAVVFCCPLELRDFFTEEAPPVTVREYLTRIVKYTYASPAVLVVACLYLDRLLLRHQALLLVPFNVLRLILTATRVASKVMDTRTLNNKDFAYVGGMNTEELNKLELIFTIALDCQLHVSAEEFHAYAFDLIMAAAGMPMTVSLASISATVPAQLPTFAPTSLVSPVRTLLQGQAGAIPPTSPRQRSISRRCSVTSARSNQSFSVLSSGGYVLRSASRPGAPPSVSMSSMARSVSMADELCSSVMISDNGATATVSSVIGNANANQTVTGTGAANNGSFLSTVVTAAAAAAAAADATRVPPSLTPPGRTSAAGTNGSTAFNRPAPPPPPPQTTGTGATTTLANGSRRLPIIRTHNEGGSSSGSFGSAAAGCVNEMSTEELAAYESSLPMGFHPNSNAANSNGGGGGETDTSFSGNSFAGSLPRPTRQRSTSVVEVLPPVSENSASLGGGGGPVQIVAGRPQPTTTIVAHRTVQGGTAASRSAVIPGPPRGPSPKAPS